MLTIIIESERPEKESLSLVSTPKSAMFTISVFPYLFAISSDTPRLSLSTFFLKPPHIPKTRAQETTASKRITATTIITTRCHFFRFFHFLLSFPGSLASLVFFFLRISRAAVFEILLFRFCLRGT